MKKALTIVFSLILIIASLPLVASANDAVYYLDGNGNLQSVTDYTVVTHNNNNTLVTWTNGWYVVNENTQINGRITVSGIVHLIILDGVLLNVTGGIEVDEGNFFFVYGQGLSNGVLGATSSGNYAPAIGSTSSNDDPVNYGTIVINGCTVNAICTSGYWAAAIGSGEGASGGDNIIINAGSVTATASTSSSGAGIGGGNKSSGGNITINGGIITANGPQYYGTGIGGAVKGTGGTITINGGTVTATGGASSAGIGGSSETSGNITINGGTVTATGGSSAAGIGGGSYKDADTITINGGTVTATGGTSGAGIGGGAAHGYTAITITGGNITANGGATNATSGVPAAGIGAGYRTSSSNAVNFGPLTLGWTNDSDSITASSISAESLVYDRDFCFVSDGVYYKALSDNTAGQKLLPITFGDVNADGLIELADYTLVKQMLSGENVTVSGKNLLAADIEYDTAVDAFDLFYLDKRINNIA